MLCLFRIEKRALEKTQLQTQTQVQTMTLT